MFDHKRKKKLENAKKYVTGHEAECFNAVFRKLNSLEDGAFQAGTFKMKYVYSEVKTPGKGEVEVIEDVPESIDNVYSISFDVTDTAKNELIGIVFYRDSVSTYPSMPEKEIERIVMSILG
jgi:hypothetical protein